MLVAISSLIGGIFGLITILILTFYLLIEAGRDVRVSRAASCRAAGAPTSRLAARQERLEGERVAARPVHPGRA